MGAPFFDMDDRGVHEIASLSGRVRVPFKWLLPHEVTDDAQVSATYPIGARYPVLRRSGKSRYGRFTVHAVTTGQDTTVLKNLLSEDYPVGLAHSLLACQTEECDIPARLAVQVMSWTRSREDTGSLQRTVWTLDVLPVDESLIDVPVSTWWDVAEDFNTWYEPVAVYDSWHGVSVREPDDGGA